MTGVVSSKGGLAGTLIMLDDVLFYTIDSFTSFTHHDPKSHSGGDYVLGINLRKVTPMASSIYTIFGYDVGQHTKAIKFGGNDQGQLWFTDGFPEKTPRVETPHDIPAHEFMMKLRIALTTAGHWGTSHDLYGFSLCGPVVQNTCLRLINRGINDSFEIREGGALNDGMAATLGSWIAGVAKDHDGALACLTLGSGIGIGTVHWDATFKLVSNDGEAHVIVRSDRRCNGCHRLGCLEGAANEAALRDYAREEGFELPAGKKLGWEFERILRDEEKISNQRTQVQQAVIRWHSFLAQGIGNFYVALNMGGSEFLDPAMFVLGGGLSFLVNEAHLRDLVLEEFGGHPFLGENFVIKRESVLGNRAGCVGAAAMALARKLQCDITKIKFVDEPPTA
jgi:hypothetical protein